ncbi:MAG: M23 family peptidase, partial [Polaromonas sp.]
MPLLHPTPLPPLSLLPLTRRSALLAAGGLLALPAARLSAATAPITAPPVPSGVWPAALQVPGGVARLSLGPSAERPVAFAHTAGAEVPVLVLGDTIDWTALVGIALSATPGEAGITVQTAERGQREISYTVAAKRYSEQRLTVAPGTVDLSPEDEARYERERAHQEGVMATFSQPLPPPLLRMQVPVPGRRSSSFGLRRVFNGQSR